jgi:hypothetical protein
VPAPATPEHLTPRRLLVQVFLVQKSGLNKKWPLGAIFGARPPEYRKAVLPGEPLAAVADNLAVRDVVYSLTEVPDVSLLVLGVIVERVLNELTILVLLDVDDCDRNFRDAVGSLNDARLDAYFRPNKKKISLGPFKDGEGNRRERDERVINLR